MKNIMLCRKYKVKTVTASFAENPFGMRSPYDVMSLFKNLGMGHKEANAARIVSCINGCAGLNPAAFRECVEALHYLLDPIERPADAIVRLRQVLAHAEERG